MKQSTMLALLCVGVVVLLAYESGRYVGREESSFHRAMTLHLERFGEQR